MALTQEELEFYSRPLSHSQLFNGMKPEWLHALILNSEIIQFERGHQLIAQETKVEGLHVILEGAVKVQKSGTELTRLGRGGFFGEISLFGASFGATADIQSLDPGKILLIKPEGLKNWAQQHPEAERLFLRKLCTELCRRLTLANDRI